MKDTAALRARLAGAAEAMEASAQDAAREGNVKYAAVVSSIVDDIREAIAALAPETTETFMARAVRREPWPRFDSDAAAAPAPEPTWADGTPIIDTLDEDIRADRAAAPAPEVERWRECAQCQAQYPLETRGHSPCCDALLIVVATDRAAAAPAPEGLAARLTAQADRWERRDTYLAGLLDEAAAALRARPALSDETLREMAQEYGNCGFGRAQPSALSHYCPNCDNSIGVEQFVAFARAVARAVLASQQEQPK